MCFHRGKNYIKNKLKKMNFNRFKEMKIIVTMKFKALKLLQ